MADLTEVMPREKLVSEKEAVEARKQGKKKKANLTEVRPAPAGKEQINEER